MKKQFWFLVLILIISITGCGEKVTIFQQVEKGDVEAVQKYIQGKGDVNAANENGKSLLVLAVTKSQLDVIELLLANNPTQIEEAFDLAVERGNEKMIRLFAEKTAVDLRIGSKIALRKMDLNLVRLLHDLGSDTAALSEAEEVLVGAVDSVNFELVRYLLDIGVPINVLDSEGRTALGMAIQKGYLQLAEELLGRGANPNVAQSIYPLVEAVSQDNLEAVQLLLDHGANPNQKTAEGDTVLCYALDSHASTEIIELLVDKGGDVLARNKKDISAIEVAFYDYHFELVKKMFESAADKFSDEDSLKIFLSYEEKSPLYGVGDLTTEKLLEMVIQGYSLFWRLADLSDRNYEDSFEIDGEHFAYLPEDIDTPEEMDAYLETVYTSEAINTKLPNFPLKDGRYYVRSDYSATSGTINSWECSVPKFIEESEDGRVRKYKLLVPQSDWYGLDDVEFVRTEKGWRLNTCIR